MNLIFLLVGLSILILGAEIIIRGSVSFGKSSAHVFAENVTKLCWGSTVIVICALVLLHIILDEPFVLGVCGKGAWCKTSTEAGSPAPTSVDRN